MTVESIIPQPSCADPNEFGSLRFEDALQQIMNTVEPIKGYEFVPLAQAVDRTLHQPIVATANVPAHTNSAVDGFAIRSEDIPESGHTAQLAVIDTTLAGSPTNVGLRPNTAIRIMTGAVIPRDADTVLMQEHVETLDDNIRISDRHCVGDNVRYAGEDLRTGENILPAGRFCTPADIGLIASIGLGEIKVKRRIRVALFSTGSEIHSIGKALEDGELYDSNRYTLRAALTRLGTEIIDYGIVPDDKIKLLETFNQATASCDALITTGGVSVGTADYTKEVLKDLGQMMFSKVAIKPGRPMVFGSINGSSFFGLPGNPVAVMVTYYQFVLPALLKIMGITETLLMMTLKARCTEAIRKKPGRTEFQRAIVSQSENEWLVRTAGKQGSGILKSMSLANAFIILPHDDGPVKPGEEVLVQPFSGLV